jgi:hypothetical protein
VATSVDIDHAATFARWAGLEGHEHELLALEAVPLIEQGEVVALGAMDGSEIHFAAAPSWRGRLVTRRRLRQYLGPLLAKRGYLTTRSIGRSRFVERIGFEETARSVSDGQEVWHYMLTELTVDRS